MRNDAPYNPFKAIVPKYLPTFYIAYVTFPEHNIQYTYFCEHYAVSIAFDRLYTTH